MCAYLASPLSVVGLGPWLPGVTRRGVEGGNVGVRCEGVQNGLSLIFSWVFWGGCGGVSMASWLAAIGRYAMAACGSAG